MFGGDEVPACGFGFGDAVIVEVKSLVFIIEKLSLSLPHPLSLVSFSTPLRYLALGSQICVSFNSFTILILSPIS